MNAYVNQSIPPELFTFDAKQARNQAYLTKLQRSYDEYKAGLAVPHELSEVADA